MNRQISLQIDSQTTHLISNAFNLSDKLKLFCRLYKDEKTKKIDFTKVINRINNDIIILTGSDTNENFNQLMNNLSAYLNNCRQNESLWHNEIIKLLDENDKNPRNLRENKYLLEHLDEKISYLNIKVRNLESKLYHLHNTENYIDEITTIQNEILSHSSTLEQLNMTKLCCIKNIKIIENRIKELENNAFPIYELQKFNRQEITKINHSMILINFLSNPDKIDFISNIIGT